MPARASIALLAAMLCAIIASAALTIQMLKGQRAMLEDAVKESQAQAVELLAERLERTLLTATRAPFLALKNIPPSSVDARRLAQLKETFPEVEQVLFLDPDLKLRGSLPQPHTFKQRRLNEWLAQRTALEGIDAKDGAVPHTLLETIDGHPTLFCLQRVSEMDRSVGWILMLFDLDVMEKRLVENLLKDFSARQGGSVRLQDAQADWDDDALNWPVGRMLPGWTLVFKPDPKAEASRVQGESTLVLGVTAGVILTMIMATFAVWRELRREHALIELRNRFVANVSHELKTPLALIRMYAETLYLKRVTDSGRQHEYHHVLLRESERLSRMINTVLDFSRLSQGVSQYRLTETDLRGTVLGVLEDYRWHVEDQGLRLVVELERGIPPVPHDRYGITQVLINLVDNAIKYGAQGKVVTVELRASGPWVTLSVTDGGPGIPASDRARVRRPFERGRDADPAGGSGLGLALVEQIAKAHHALFVLETAGAHGAGLKASVRFPMQNLQP